MIRKHKEECKSDGLTMNRIKFEYLIVGHEEISYLIPDARK